MTDPVTRLTEALADRYRIGRELGKGGMATVYLAEDVKHQRQVAVKVLRPELASLLGPERFQREIQLAARLQHPHILPVFDSGEAAGQLWYAMPYVEGDTLRDRLEREPQLPLDEALHITREIAAALGHAHQQGIVHRDIKPENILLSGGHAVVADFGIARALDAAGGQKLTETGMALGTPTYMSPEQGSGDSRLDGRSDLYALGVVLYEMLAGAPPFTGPTSQSIRARHAIDPIPSLRTVRTTVPESVEAAITKALAKVPADRFATTAEFVVALTQPHPAVTASAKRRPRVLPLAVLALVVMVAGALLFRGFGRDTSTNANLIAVAPFRVSAAEPALGYLREGMIDLLGATFNGEAGPRTVEARSVTGA
jgi:serine/threonine-protein kinase